MIWLRVFYKWFGLDGHSYTKCNGNPWTLQSQRSWSILPIFCSKKGKLPWPVRKQTWFIVLSSVYYRNYSTVASDLMCKAIFGFSLIVFLICCHLDYECKGCSRFHFQTVCEYFYVILFQGSIFEVKGQKERFGRKLIKGDL